MITRYIQKCESSTKIEGETEKTITRYTFHILNNLILDIEYPNTIISNYDITRLCHEIAFQKQMILDYPM